MRQTHNYAHYIDRKVKFMKLKLFCYRISEWFEAAEVDEIIGAMAVTMLFLGIYCAAAQI